MEKSLGRQRIDLHMNFRSRAQVLDFCNDIFYKIMSPDLGRVAYDRDAARRRGITFIKTCIEYPMQVFYGSLPASLIKRDSSTSLPRIFFTEQMVRDSFALVIPT